MLSRLFFLLICGNIAEYLGNAKKLPRAKRQSLKVQINATEDTIAMKFLRPSPNMQLEGFIMGYGSNIFSSQYIQLPAHGKSYETEIDAEPRYLISVKPVANPKKSCSGKNSQKPLQVVVGTLSPTSVFLSWGVLINPQHDWTVMNNCPNDRFYTVRFREKDKTKKWHFQLCPATETLIENLKPNTIYEFGVKDNSEDGVWTKAVNHQTSMPSKNKENGQIQNTYKIPKGQILMAPEDMKKLITIQVIKQVIQNITNMKPLNPKPTVGPSPPEATPGHKKILHGVPEPTKVEVLETPKPKLAVAERAPENIKATVSTGLDLSKAAPAHIESKTRSLKPDSTSSPQPPVSTRATVQTFLRPSAPKVPYKVQYDLSSPENSKKEEISQPESATNSPDLETTISLITSTPQVFRTASAGNVAHPLPARPKPSDHLHLQDTKSALDIPQVIPEATMRFTVSTTAATSQTTLESIPSENLPTLEWVRATRVSNETPFVPSKADQSASPEAKPVTSTLKMSTATHQTPQEPAAAKTATILREPKLTMGKEAITDKQLIPSLPKASVRPEMSHTKPVAASQTRPGTILAPALSSKQPTVTLGNVISEKQLIPSLPKASVKPEMSHTKPAPTESLALPSKPKITSRPEIPQTKPAKQIVLDSKTSKAAEPRTTLAPKEKTYFQSEPEMSPKPDMSQHEPVSTSLPITKPVTAKSSDTVKQEQSTQAAYRKILYPLTTKSPLISERRRTTTAPKTIHLAPSKPKPSSRPGAPQTKPVPNETQKLIEPETTQIPESPGPKKTPWAPINLKRLNIFEDPRIPLFANETEPRIVPSSSKPKTRQTTKTPYTRAVPNATQKTSSSVPKTTVRPHSRSAPSGIITEPVMSKLPVPPQRPKATLGPYKVRSPRPRTSARPWIRPVDGTTQGSIRTKPLDESNWLPGNTNNGRLVGLDISKPLGVSRNTSMEPNNTRKGLVSGPSPPQRVFPPPTQHTYTRRRPYPFHNVTGRPGGPGTVMPRTMRFTAKPTQFSVAQKTQMPMKQTTFSASELDDANDTIFNPKPKSELDPQGKSRFTASHVKYIRKDDRVPCSITESLKHFPAEQASNQDITSPPQNPPSNLTVVTVEGCSSFVILDWEQPDNDTVTEYEVISRENGGTTGHDQSILTTNQTYSTVENLKPDTSYEFKVKPRNPLGEGPTSNTVEFSTESADPRVSEFISGGKDAIWTELSFKSDGFSECKGKQYVKRTWYKKFVGIQLCNSLRYKIYLSDSLTGNFYNIGDQTGHGEDHCQFVDSFLDGRTGQHLLPDQLPTRKDITSAGRFTLYRSAPHHSFVSTCLSEQPEHSLEMVVQTSLFGSSDSLFGN
ncbi:target of Nesh-SH3 isoform X46 [Microcaecilia unicolor]|uniref:Target of Nesh-SH3 isoform X46 n=1 Tax=Microcaecilia unicolor TaxID=1415580 RepID=A0A6P7XX43_9AMPH|nr:target of Nesh-SH3 isoform X46 [Microcaecilia unicolor]